MVADILVGGIIAVTVSIAEIDTDKEPHLAIRTGLSCSSCHVNRSGGGKRTIFGMTYGQTQLPRTPGEFLLPVLNEFLSVGADARFVARALVTDATPRTTLEVEEANFYIQANLLQDRLILYLDQTVGPNRAVSREIFALVGGLPLNGYAKVGKFLLPFGLRLQDDGAFIRQRTGFTFQTPDQGIEIGIEPGPFVWFLSLTNGSVGAVENDSEKQVSTSAVYVNGNFRLGVSASHDGGQTERNVIGGYGGIRLGPVSLMGEFDYIFDDSNTGETDQLVAYGSIDYLASPGLNAKLTYGYLDPNRDIPENERTRLRIGLEYFPQPFWSVSGFYTVLEDIPQATTDQDQVSIELHVFF